MPLHDHPKMIGLLKCVSGRLRIQSYTRTDSSEDEILVTSSEPKTVDHQASSSYLDENTSNYHEITAIDGPAAFFDILSPPYSSDVHDNGPDSDRHCHFYSKRMVDNSPEKKILKLEPIDCPSHYYCDSITFAKPEYMR